VNGWGVVFVAAGAYVALALLVDYLFGRGR